MQEDAGMERSCNGWIGLVLSFFFSLHALYYQYELNRIWARLGEPAGRLPGGPARHRGRPVRDAERDDARPAGPARRRPRLRRPTLRRCSLSRCRPPASQAARSGGAPGLSSDGTSTNSGPADGDSTEG